MGFEILHRDFGIVFEHHDAAEDAYAAGEILLRALRDTNLSVDDWLIKLDRRSPRKTTSKRITRASNENGPLAGEVLVFTGALTIPREEAAELAAEIGCEVAGGVTRKTTILVVGDNDFRGGETKSTKHREAEDLIGQGQAIKILRESDFRNLVSY